MGIRLALVAALVVACHGGEQQRPATETIRCAVIGGMLETGFWPELAERYRLVTGNKIEVVASGPKPIVIDAFRKGGVDLVTVHASDAMVNLVADGLAVDPQPWVKNDLVIVGPADDPAKIAGGKDAVAALGAIIAAKQPFIVHASLGADGVLHDLVEAGHLVFAKDELVLFDGENQHEILERAAALHAYTLVGRIPFTNGKLKREGIAMMVRSDPRLRRPYLVAVASKGDPARLAAAKDFAAYLRSPETQAWIATFHPDASGEPLFYPVELAH